MFALVMMNAKRESLLLHTKHEAYACLKAADSTNELFYALSIIPTWHVQTLESERVARFSVIQASPHRRSRARLKVSACNVYAMMTYNTML